MHTVSKITTLITSDTYRFQNLGRFAGVRTGRVYRTGRELAWSDTAVNNLDMSEHRRRRALASVMLLFHSAGLTQPFTFAWLAYVRQPLRPCCVTFPRDLCFAV
jgi:hypothetical protein